MASKVFLILPLLMGNAWAGCRYTNPEWDLTSTTAPSIQAAVTNSQGLVVQVKWNQSLHRTDRIPNRHVRKIIQTPEDLCANSGWCLVWEFTWDQDPAKILLKPLVLLIFSPKCSQEALAHNQKLRSMKKSKEWEANLKAKSTVRQHLSHSRS